MNIVYHCYGSSHSSVTAAAIHLRWLPRNRLPSARELLSIPHFDQTEQHEVGTPFFMGIDQNGHRIFIMGRKRAMRLMENAVQSLLKIYGRPADEILLVNALSEVTLTTAIGGTLSRGFGLVRLGRPLAILGIQLCYFRFVQLVERTETVISQRR